MSVPAYEITITEVLKEISGGLAIWRDLPNVLDEVPHGLEFSFTQDDSNPAYYSRLWSARYQGKTYQLYRVDSALGTEYTLTYVGYGIPND